MRYKAIVKYRHNNVVVPDWFYVHADTPEQAMVMARDRMHAIYLFPDNWVIEEVVQESE